MRGARGRQGWILPGVLALALVMQVAVWTLFVQVHSHFERVVRQTKADQADRMAEAGWCWAREQLRQRPDWRGSQELALGPGHVEIVVAEEPGPSIIVVSRGRIGDTVQRSLWVEIDPATFGVRSWQEGMDFGSDP